jgi:hypothetical protein
MALRVVSAWLCAIALVMLALQFALATCRRDFAFASNRLHTTVVGDHHCAWPLRAVPNMPPGCAP